MSEPKDQKSENPREREKPAREEEARRVVEEYADDQRAVIEKLRRLN